MPNKNNNPLSRLLYTAIAVWISGLGYTTCTIPPAQMYETYLEQLTLADAAVAIQDVPLALSHYDTAFASVPYVFGRDIQQALELAVEVQHQTRVMKYAQMLLQRVCPVAYFRATRFAFMENFSGWNNLLTEFEQSPTYLKTIKPALRAQMIDLYAKDQNIALNFKNANVHPRYQAVTDRLIALEKQYGFPGEAQTGVRMENDSTIGMPYYYVIMLHHYHKKVSLFYEQLTTFVQEGNLDPRHCSEFLNQGDDDAELIARINARRKVTPKTEIMPQSIPIYQNKPVYEDSYLYPTEMKGITRRKIDGYNILLADWNNDSIFTEVGIDYFGFEMLGEPAPPLFFLQSTNYFVLNDTVLAYAPEANTIKIVSIPPSGDMPVFIDRLSAIRLTDGNTIQFSETEDVVLYFWASWCAPCIRKLNAINKDWDNWSKKSFRFVPIALQSSESSIKAIYLQNDFKIPMYIGEEATRYSYRVNSFPKSYLFTKGRFQRRLSDEELFLLK